MKAILKYTDCLHDGKRVSSVLYENNIQILRIRPGKSIYPQVTIHVNDYDELNMLIQKLNDACLYGVEVVKVNTINYSVIVIEYLLLFLCFFMLFEILCFVKNDCLHFVSFSDSMSESLYVYTENCNSSLSSGSYCSIIMKK